MFDHAPSDAASTAFSKLLAISEARGPQWRLPLDLEQSFRTIVPHTIEEAYEVADAIEQDDMEGLKGELGDLLFQRCSMPRWRARPAPSPWPMCSRR
jgi:ATP diphosphatase